MNNNCTISAIKTLLESKGGHKQTTITQIIIENDIDIWDEEEREKKYSPGTGTLNSLIENLTSTTSYGKSKKTKNK